MGTKSNPGLFDCYSSALPDEEIFHLLARDPDFPEVVEYWMERRIKRIVAGEKPFSDVQMLMEAARSAERGRQWRQDNNGLWRRSVHISGPVPRDLPITRGPITRGLIPE